MHSCSCAMRFCHKFVVKNLLNTFSTCSDRFRQITNFRLTLYVSSIRNRVFRFLLHFFLSYFVRIAQCHMEICHIITIPAKSALFDVSFGMTNKTAGTNVCYSFALVKVEYNVNRKECHYKGWLARVHFTHDTSFILNQSRGYGLK